MPRSSSSGEPDQIGAYSCQGRDIEQEVRVAIEDCGNITQNHCDHVHVSFDSAP